MDISQLQQHHGSSLRKEDWNNSDNSNHSQIAISTQRGDFLVEQIKNGSGGEQSTYFLSPINSKSIPTLKRGNNASIDMIGNLFVVLFLIFSFIYEFMDWIELHIRFKAKYICTVVFQ